MISVVLIVLVDSGTAWGSLSWFQISNPRISQLDVNLYRFRVDVAWNVDPFLYGYDYPANWWEHQMDPSIPLLPAPPMYAPGVLDSLSISLTISPGPGEYTAFNPTVNHLPGVDWPGHSLPGDWYGGYYPAGGPAETLIGSEFGWDFTYTGAPDATFDFSYFARANWNGHYFLPDGTGSYRDFFVDEKEFHSGNFSIPLDSIPEPGTAVLVFLGLMSFGAVRKRFL